MERLHYMTHIDAPKSKVWKVMLEDKTYREWTEPFMPGSYYEGSWDAGSKIRFLAPEKDGSVSGMYSIIKENRPEEFVSIQHLGEIKNNKEMPWPQDNVMLENYTFEEKDGGTTVHIDIDSNEEFKDMFEDMWPKALKKLKEVAERN